MRQLFAISLLFIAAAFAQRHPAVSLTPDDALKLEESLTANPDDRGARTALISYYFRASAQSMSPWQYRDVRRGHILWLVQHFPEDPLAGSPESFIFAQVDPPGYAQLAAAWDQAVSAKDPSAASLANAGRFFSSSEPEKASGLLERSLAKDPKSLSVAMSLAHSYTFQAQRTKDAAAAAALRNKAYRRLEAFIELDAQPGMRQPLVVVIAKAAYDAGEYAKAEQYGAELLKLAAEQPNQWSTGNSIHQGNLVLGRVALHHGDVEKAKRFLLDAGKTPGSPQLNSFGPNMALARDLLAAKQPETVTQYLDLCGVFWKQDRGKLEAWKAEIRQDKIPDFGANLVF
ncbi:MAG: hypothetical protein HY821_18800 [Acidobacteria bacterium]|nr:hypothetical protein [Acidobacteriota bacterium]